MPEDFDNSSSYNDSEDSLEDSSDDSLDSDDDEYFIRFNFTTNHDNVEYIMMGSFCFNNPALESEDITSLLDNACQHDVLIYFINGTLEQQIMTTKEIKSMCRSQGIDLSSYSIFQHLRC